MNTRSHLAPQALALRSQGHSYRQIAAHMGISPSYANDLCLDPTGTKAKARKRSYGGWCQDCGHPTSGSNGPTQAPKYCVHCSPKHQRRDPIWTTDRIIDAIQDYADKYGRPPSAWEWHPAMARSHYRDDIAERFYEDGIWPLSNTVKRHFGTWNRAIVAAGFQPLKTGHKYVDPDPHAA